VAFQCVASSTKRPHRGRICRPSTPRSVRYSQSAGELRECRLNAAFEVLRFSSLGCNFDLDQLVCTRPGQLVVGGGSPRPCCPAALLQVITLFPVRRDLLQDCQVRFRIAVLQEFLHADRREGCQDGVISPLIRKFDGGAASHPAAPRKPDDHRRDRADSYSLEETSPRLAPQN